MSRSQLLALGLSAKTIRGRIESGVLHREHAGVYAVGRPATAPIERASAAVLAAGEQALLGRQSALALWGWAQWPAEIHTVSPREHRIPGVHCHRCSTLSRPDVRRHLGVAVTSPARTLLDCAPRLSDLTLARALNDALRSGFLHEGQLSELLARRPSQAGAKRLGQIAGVAAAGATRSSLEDRFLEFCRKYGLPTPLVNVDVDGYEVDAYFPESELIVELDGWDFHRDRAAFESDRERDAQALERGRATVRITARRLAGRPASEARLLGRIIEARRERR